MDLQRYVDGREAAPFALVGQLAEELADAQTDPVYEAPGLAVLRDATVLDWREKLERPVRRRGCVLLDVVTSFINYVARFGTDETVIYACKDDATITAVLNDHPEYAGTSGESGETVEPLASRRDFIAQLGLRVTEDWKAIVTNNARMMPQRQFAELIEDLKHVIAEPDSATVLEVASTLDVKQNVDFGSKVRLQSGDVEFRYEQTSEATAGRGTRIAVPSQIVFSAPVWLGTEPVRIGARLRFSAGPDGCLMGYRLIRLDDVTDTALSQVVSTIDDAALSAPVLYGDAMVATVRRTGR